MRTPKLKLNRYTSLLFIGVTLNLVLWLLWSRFPDAQGPLTLHFRYAGPGALLGEHDALAILPGIGLLTLFVNGALTVMLYKRDVALAQIVAFSAVAVQGVLILALIALLLVNGVSA